MIRLGGNCWNYIALIILWCGGILVSRWHIPLGMPNGAVFEWMILFCFRFINVTKASDYIKQVAIFTLVVVDFALVMILMSSMPSACLFYISYLYNSTCSLPFHCTQTFKNCILMVFICREFYYIQMEKYARQALAEGAKSPEDLVITTDSELYRVLNLHYNRNNQLEVPEGFRITVQVRWVFFLSYYFIYETRYSSGCCDADIKALSHTFSHIISPILSITIYLSFDGGGVASLVTPVCFKI